MTYANSLWTRLHQQFDNKDYNGAGMDAAPAPVGPGFFPVSLGIWQTPKNDPHGTLLFLGQDFGVGPDANYQGETNAVPTWKNLEPLLASAGINAGSCFFSNVVMGTRKGPTSVGKSPAFKEPEFIKKCAEFVRVQTEVVDPEGIVVLGLHALRVLCLVDKDIPEARSFRDWDNGKPPCLREIDLGIRKVPFALLVHPSYRPVTVKYRSVDTCDRTREEGNAHEVRMLRELVDRCRQPKGSAE